MACKLKDTSLSLKEYANFIVAISESSKKEDDSVETDWISTIYFHEEEIAAELCYDFEIPDLHFDMELCFERLPDLDAKVKTKAWALLNDTFLSDLCLKHESRRITAACIHTVSNLEGKKIHEFWDNLRLREQEVVEIKEEICDLFQQFYQ